MGSGIPHGVVLPPASDLAVKHVAGSSEEDAKVVLAYDCFSEAVVGLPLAGGGGAKEHMGDGPHGVDLPPASVGADKHLHGDERLLASRPPETRALESRVLAVLAADSSEEGFTVAEIHRLLQSKHDEHEVQLSLDKLIEQQAFFNTFSYERYAAL